MANEPLLSAPRSPADLFRLLSHLERGGRLEELLARVDGLSGLTPLEIYYLAHQRAPDRLQALVHGDYSAERHLHAALTSTEFQSRVIFNFLTAFPEKRRLVFIHVPKCAGSDLMHHLAPRFLSMPHRLTSDAWVSKPELFEALGAAVRQVDGASEIFVSGHIELDAYLRAVGYRPQDRIFTVLRDPLDIVVSQANYAITLLAKDPEGTRPDARRNLELLGLQRLPSDASPAQLKDLALRAFLDTRITRANLICRHLSGGQQGHQNALRNVIFRNLEVTDTRRYNAWLNEAWGIDSQSRINISMHFLNRDDVLHLTEHIEALTGEDRKLFEIVGWGLSEQGRCSIHGAELLTLIAKGGPYALDAETDRIVTKQAAEFGARGFGGGEQPRILPTPAAPEKDPEVMRRSLVARKSRGALRAPLRDRLTQTLGGQIAPVLQLPRGKPPVTYLTIVPLEAHFHAVRVAYGNCFGFPVTIQTASVYPSDSYSSAPETMTNGGEPVAVIPTLGGNLNRDGRRLTFSDGGVEPRRSLTLPGDPGNVANALLPYRYEWSDWVDCRSLPRRDGGTQPLLFIYTTIASPAGTFVRADFRALNNGGYGRERHHYGLLPAGGRADFADNPDGTRFFAAEGGRTSWNPVLVVQYAAEEPGVQVISVGDSLARAPTDDGFSSAVWRACMDLSSPELPIAYAGMAFGAVGPAVYHALTRLNADAIQPSVAALQVITRNGYAGRVEHMRRLWDLTAALIAELAGQHETRPIFNIPGGEPAWDAQPSQTGAFVQARNTLWRASQQLGIPLIDAPSVTAPAAAPWAYSDGVSDDNTHLNNFGTEKVVPLARAALQQVLETDADEIVVKLRQWASDLG